jgi:hypothetical protein
VGETRVDLLHLLEDLRDAYPGALEETILTEMVANSLDSGAGRIRLVTNAAQGCMTVTDNGAGMKRRELARYHDIAASTKTRGQGIGFAGVGIKLGLLACQQVLTETRRGKVHVATRWHLASRNRAPWKWINPPPGQVAERGTAVSLTPHNALSPLLDAGFVEGTIRRHYQPLLDPLFDSLLVGHYRNAIVFEVNGRVLERRSGVRLGDPEPFAASGDVARLEVKLAHKRKPSALGYLVRGVAPVPEEQQGVAISTLGKVIKRGWDWLGITPTSTQRISGLVEAPALAASLTLSKGDFIRSGPRGAAYLSYRKAIQEAVSRQLEDWGDAREADEVARRRVARPVERDLERVLLDLADEFPLLASLVERRPGGQRRLPIGKPDTVSDPRSLVAAYAATATEEAPSSQPVSAEEPDEVANPLSMEAPATAKASLPGATGARKPAHYGLTIQFESRAEDPELGRLVESTVWVNEAHPAYRRASASRSEGYHVALAVALALAPLAVEPAGEHQFVTTFLARWGETLRPASAPRSRRR